MIQSIVLHGALAGFDEVEVEPIFSFGSERANEDVLGGDTVDTLDDWIET